MLKLLSSIFKSVISMFSMNYYSRSAFGPDYGTVYLMDEDLDE